MKTQFGFTLVEMMVVIALIAILSTYAFPSLRYSILNNRITSKTNLLVNSLNYARSEAVIRGGKIGLVPADKTGLDWSQGWEVVSNPTSTSPTVIKTFDFANDGIQITETNLKTAITYTSRGGVLEAQANPLFFNVCVKDRSRGDPYGRLLKIEPTGRVSLEDAKLSCTAK
jgi:type IV fimbrial biogenesis protein FimT